MVLVVGGSDETAGALKLTYLPTMNALSMSFRPPVLLKVNEGPGF